MQNGKEIKYQNQLLKSNYSRVLFLKRLIPAIVTMKSNILCTIHAITCLHILTLVLQIAWYIRYHSLHDCKQLGPQLAAWHWQEHYERHPGMAYFTWYISRVRCKIWHDFKASLKINSWCILLIRMLKYVPSTLLPTQLNIGHCLI